MGLEAGVADDAADIFFGGAGVGGNNSDVVGSEAEGHLEDFEADGSGGLDVGDVVEVEAADGESAEVLDGGGFDGAGGDVEREGGEGRALCLEGAQVFEPVDELGGGFADSDGERGDDGLGWGRLLVDVVLEGVGDDVFGVDAAADGVGFHADADEVVGGEAVEGLGSGDAHGVSLLRRECGLRGGRHG